MSVPEYFLRDKISEAIAGRAFPVMAPVDARPPYAIYARAGTERERTMLGPSGVASAEFLVVVYAETYFDTKSMAVAIRQAVDNFTGQHDGCDILTTFETSESDGDPVEYEGEGKPAYTTELTFQIRYREV